MGDNIVIREDAANNETDAVAGHGGALDPKLRAEELIANLSTRQSSTLVVVTVAASASLALLALYPSSSSNLPIPPLENWAGFLFPIAGIAYRQLTVLSDTVDRSELNGIRGRLNFRPRWASWVIRIRKWILLSFLASPSALWWLRIINYAVSIWYLVIIIGLVSGFLVLVEDRLYESQPRS